MHDYYTYLLIDPRDNRPFYVGKGRNHRMTIHERRAKLGIVSNKNQFLFNKINKILTLGLSIRYKKPIKNVSESEAFRWETKFIKCLRKKGYKLCNIGDGGIATRGNLGKHHSEKTRRKWSELRKGMFTLPWFIEKYGRDGERLYNERNASISQSQIGKTMPPVTPETREKLRISHIGKKQSPETISKRSAAMKGKFIGRIVSEKTKQKISISRKGTPSSMMGRKHTTESKQKMINSHVKRYMFISPTNEKINIINLKKFCKDNALNYGNMSSVATKHRKSCQGWTLAELAFPQQ